MRFKLDAAVEWDDDHVAALAQLDVVDTVDDIDEELERGRWQLGAEFDDAYVMRIEQHRGDIDGVEDPPWSAGGSRQPCPRPAGEVRPAARGDRVDPGALLGRTGALPLSG